jgi:hypothetical protein
VVNATNVSGLKIKYSMLQSKTEIHGPKISDSLLPDVYCKNSFQASKACQYLYLNSKSWSNTAVRWLDNKEKSFSDICQADTLKLYTRVLDRLKAQQPSWHDRACYTDCDGLVDECKVALDRCTRAMERCNCIYCTHALKNALEISQDPKVNNHLGAITFNTISQVTNTHADRTHLGQI